MFPIGLNFTIVIGHRPLCISNPARRFLREREREREIERERERESVCVCVRERESEDRKRESEGNIGREILCVDVGVYARKM